MADGPNIVRIAALIGDNARAEVLSALMSDRALTAKELAGLAGVTKQTVSFHLGKLLDAGLLEVERQGRHRYFRLAGADVAELLESLMGLAGRTERERTWVGPRALELRRARICYDHLAGELGVQVFEKLVELGMLRQDQTGLWLTESGRAWFAGMGIDTDALGKLRRVFCKACLDWSERRHHLAGALGAALLLQITDRGWARRAVNSRAIIFTNRGEKSLREALAPQRPWTASA
jgi:DNA-binding transcriptional ArsR family regulator